MQRIGEPGMRRLSLADFPDEDDFCRQCGKALPHDKWLGLRKFCCSACRNRWHGQNDPEMRMSYGLADCLTCGTSFHMRRPESKYCSSRCYGEAIKKAPDRTCQECGAPFKAKNPVNKFCSRACWVKATRLPSRQCGWCGATFKPSAVTVRFCSKACARHDYWARKPARTSI